MCMLQVEVGGVEEGREGQNHLNCLVLFFICTNWSHSPINSSRTMSLGFDAVQTHTVQFIVSIA